jgi:hypothetical protein
LVLVVNLRTGHFVIGGSFVTDVFGPSDVDRVLVAMLIVVHAPAWERSNVRHETKT